MKIISRAFMGFLSVLGTSSFAAPPDLSNLNIPQVDTIFQTFGAATAFRPVEPASTYGSYWGLSLGGVANLASANKLKQVVTSTSIDFVPSGSLFVGLQAPAGFGIELGILPARALGGLNLKSTGGDFKWTLNPLLFPMAPVDVALRVALTSTTLSYSETISGVRDTVTFKSKVTGANVGVSKRLFYVFEPYVGLGIIRQAATLSSTGSAQLFNSTVTASASLDKTHTSLWAYAGLQLRLVFITLSGEYGSLFGIDTYAFKAALKF